MSLSVTDLIVLKPDNLTARWGIVVSRLDTDKAKQRRAPSFHNILWFICPSRFNVSREVNNNMTDVFFFKVLTVIASFSTCNIICLFISKYGRKDYVLYILILTLFFFQYCLVLIY